LIKSKSENKKFLHDARRKNLVKSNKKSQKKNEASLANKYAHLDEVERKREELIKQKQEIVHNRTKTRAILFQERKRAEVDTKDIEREREILQRERIKEEHAERARMEKLENVEKKRQMSQETRHQILSRQKQLKKEWRKKAKQINRRIKLGNLI